MTHGDHVAVGQSEQITVLTVSENLSTPLLRYWQTYYEERRPPALPPRNCLGFVCYMAGVTIGSIDEAFAVSDAMFRQGRPWDAAEPLPMGEIGIIANPTYGGDWPNRISVHAFVGLGSAVALEVKAVDGYMALDSQAAILDYQRHFERPDGVAVPWTNDGLELRAYRPNNPL
jgi:hypothetical protein